MKNEMIALLLLASAEAYSGGSFGGNPPALQGLDTLALMNLSIENLPKAYADQDDLRRAAARLGVVGTEITDLAVDGSTIKVRKLRDSVVDEAVSKVILPQ